MNYDEPNYAQTSFRIPVMLLRKAKTTAIHAGITLTEFFNNAVEEAVETYAHGYEALKREGGDNDVQGND
jgi:hypothetical protein